MFSTTSDWCLYNLFRKQITAANYIFIFSWQKRIYSCGKYNCSSTCTCLCSYVHTPELSVDIVTLHGSLDHWIMLMLVIHSISDQERDESPMQRYICLQTDHKIPNICELKSNLNMTGCVSRDKFNTDRYAASLHEQKILLRRQCTGNDFFR